METKEIKEKISNYLVDGSTSLKDNLTKIQLNELKELLNQAQKLGIINDFGGRTYECYLDEINRKVKTFED